MQFALPQSGKHGGAPYWDSDFIVVVVDAHNGLQLIPNQYTGLGYTSPIGKTVYQAYEEFMDKLSHFAQFVHCFSDCSERFQMGPDSMRSCVHWQKWLRHTD